MIKMEWPHELFVEIINLYPLNGASVWVTRIKWAQAPIMSLLIKPASIELRRLLFFPKALLFFSILLENLYRYEIAGGFIFILLNIEH
jgi:hypothetical protein